MKVVFFGTPEFGAAILRKLIRASLKPVLVVTPPDKPAGRNRELTPSETKLAAQEYGVPLLETETFSDKTFQELRETEPDLFVLASYGRILPKKVLAVPRKGTLNVHPSLLPKYRGPSPVQETILQGDEKTGVTIMLMDEEVDHGPILAQREFPQSPAGFTAEELKAQLAVLGGDLLIEVIPQWMEGKIEPKPQDHGKATFTKMVAKEQGKIDWSKDAEFIERQVRAFTPWPGTFTSWQGKLLKVLEASTMDHPGYEAFEPGSVFSLKGRPAVMTGSQALVLERVQLEGKKPASGRDFLLGYKDFLKARLG